jgi:hypothetical protein
MTVVMSQSVATISSIFELADDGRASDVAREKDQLIAKAICDEQMSERERPEPRVCRNPGAS